MEEARDWSRRAIAFESVGAKVDFVLSTTFYLGDQNDVDQMEDPAFRTPLPIPPEAQVADGYGGLSIEDADPVTLGAYFQVLLQHIAALGQQTTGHEQYFWLRLYMLDAAGDPILTFPWYDKLEEFRNLLHRLKALEDQDEYQDMEQGWWFDVYRNGAQLYLRQWDFEAQAWEIVVSTALHPLIVRLEEALERAGALISKLAGVVGKDLWSHRDTSYLSRLS